MPGRGQDQQLHVGVAGRPGHAAAGHGESAVAGEVVVAEVGEHTARAHRLDHVGGQRRGHLLADDVEGGRQLGVEGRRRAGSAAGIGKNARHEEPLCYEKISSIL
ncbi:hypothetical protein [Paractinoplanes hotanensis]|uniref:Uncharacterized protein n=1 Tax=Paractinoplanes hotanensis TaxID=2906497 RepID=A0ABT0Y8X5_9ACTN|nr:hypothetical protein [Actinoplanes hotanensis]MCM4082496.1 hypothetical protein [Actinoplanes hotanensis]